jgi:hypothetical protein
MQEGDANFLKGVYDARVRLTSRQCWGLLRRGSSALAKRQCHPNKEANTREFPDTFNELSVPPRLTPTASNRPAQGNALGNRFNPRQQAL